MQSVLRGFVTKILQPAYIGRNFVIPSALILVYSVIYSLLLNRLFGDKTVNYDFSVQLAIVSLVILLISLLIYGIARLRAVKSQSVHISSRLDIFTFILISLLPLSPIARYLIANRDILSALDTVTIFMTFFALAVLLVAIIPFIIINRNSDKILLSTANAFSFTMFNMASVSQSLSWYEEGSTVVQLVLFCFALVGTWLLLRLKRNDLTVVIVVFLVGSIMIQILSQNNRQTEEVSTGTDTEDYLMETVLNREPDRTPNIYLLIYDSYVPNEILLNYGINNSDQENFLVEQGFKLYPHTYSIGRNSLESMNAVLNASATYYGNRIGVNGGGRVHRLLQLLNYRNFGVFGTNYFFRGLANEPEYDYYTPQSEVMSTYQLLTGAIGIGEFRFDLDLQDLPYEEYLSLKREVFANPIEDPLFVYTHSMRPGHSQFSGACRSNETDLYIERLQTANAEMTQDVNLLITTDPDAIIIVAGDHGPYLTKNCTVLSRDYQPSDINRSDIQSRYGSFLAIRWPSDDYHEYDQITVLQDIFPSIFAWMYRDATLLEARVAPVTLNNTATAGVEVHNGVIVGGVDDGQPLYLSDVTN